jgi:hypothetical protein
MKKYLIILCIAIFAMPTVGAFGTTFTFEPTPKDLYDLDHYKYYTWGIDWTVPQGETIVGASLSFENIRNSEWGQNDLWVHLLDSAASGVTVGSDWQSGGDHFAGNGVLLNHWEDLPAWPPQDINYVFDEVELAALMNYAGDGNFGLGFDPDCKFYNDGIALNVQTSPAPEPATILLLGSGLVGLAGVGRKKYLKGMK